MFLACAHRAREEFEASIAGAHRAADGDLERFVELGGRLLFDLLYEEPSRWALLFSGAVGESGDLAVELSKLRFSTVEKIGLLAGAYAPNLDPEELQAFANAISGISEAFCRWSLHNPEIPRESILGYYRDVITARCSRPAARCPARPSHPAQSLIRSRHTMSKSTSPSRWASRRTSRQCAGSYDG